MLALAIVSTCLIALFMAAQSIATGAKDGIVGFIGASVVNAMLLGPAIVTIWLMYARLP
jgi:hypothetical protein